MRLNTIDCNKGELIKKNHILLQFTGLHDKEGEEIYDRDVLMKSLEKYVVVWNEIQNGWFYVPITGLVIQVPFVAAEAQTMKRFCNYFELAG